MSTSERDRHTHRHAMQSSHGFSCLYEIHGAFPRTLEWAPPLLICGFWSFSLHSRMGAEIPQPQPQWLSGAAPPKNQHTNSEPSCLSSSLPTMLCSPGSQHPRGFRNPPDTRFVMLPHLQLLLWAGQPNRWHLLLQYLTDLHRLHFG